MDTIEVSKEEKQGIIDYYNVKIKQLEDKVSHYKSLIAKLNGSIKDNPQKVITETPSDVYYVPNATSPQIVNNPEDDEDKPSKIKIPRKNWKYLCVNSLNKLDCFSTSNEIYEDLIEKNEDLAKYDKTDVVSKISTALI